MMQKHDTLTDFPKRNMSSAHFDVAEVHWKAFSGPIIGRSTRDIPLFHLQKHFLMLSFAPFPYGASTDANEPLTRFSPSTLPLLWQKVGRQAGDSEVWAAAVRDCLFFVPLTATLPPMW